MLVDYVRTQAAEGTVDPLRNLQVIRTTVPITALAREELESKLLSMPLQVTAAYIRPLKHFYSARFCGGLTKGVPAALARVPLPRDEGLHLRGQRGQQHRRRLPRFRRPRECLLRGVCGLRALDANRGKVVQGPAGRGGLVLRVRR